ncbi:MAG: formate/nitrite transporter family protein [Thermodesulfovibrionales bacterium]|nr:formate/nitrite transporter family protein [Thermodesulfovibrionales bacterium]
MAEIFGFDAYSPKEIAEKVENVGVTKAQLPFMSVAMLGVLAGAFIALGAMYFTLVTCDKALSFGLSRLLGGLTFSLGLVLVVVAGAELFTGNNLLVMAWVSKRISTKELLKNWLIVYAANFVGAFGIALLVLLSNHWSMGGTAVGRLAVDIAAFKTSIPFWEAFFKGVLCNLLVCLAVWLTLAGRSVMDKIAAIIFPISAFVAAGFEHSIANMYFIPLGIMLHKMGIGSGLQNTDGLNLYGFAHNLIPVTLGNIIGGSVLVALVYYVVYRRAPKTHE